MKPDPLENPLLYTGVESEPERHARRQLLRYCIEQGATIEQLLEVVREGRLATFPLEFALTSGRRYTLTGMAREAGVPAPYMRAVLLALGQPNPRPRERVFSEEDLNSAKALGTFLQAGLPRAELLDVARVVSQSMARTAAVIRRYIGNALIQPGDSEHDLGMRYAAAAEELAPHMAPILQNQLRVHLREQATREVIGRSEREAGALRNTRDVGVCFVDLSGFTRLGERVAVEQVGALGTRMALMCVEVAHPPVELVKTIGDGAMFVSTDVNALLDATCTLAANIERESELAHKRHEQQGEIEQFPAARAGVAFGPAVDRVGDWFGATVNRASRIADAARPGTILADEAVRKLSAERFEWVRSRRRNLKGIDGRTVLYRLAGPDELDEGDKASVGARASRRLARRRD
ncbi:MAG TPA: adenylate cyclase regulatory domain-containing protein [Solirubrobacteraceae bacterium]|nr:adenylate cyclase regulatory domain-containing protein [Solirubrobacteraceae bacterium]